MPILAFIIRCVVVLSIAFITSDSAFAAEKKKKKRVKAVAVQEITVGEQTYLCAQKKNGKWIPVESKRNGKKYVKIKDKAAKEACNSELEETEAVSSFNSIPNLGDLLANGEQSSDLLRSLTTAPSIDDIADAVDNGTFYDLFFASDVVSAIESGSATQSQCDSFFQGLGACHMVESTARTMQDLLAQGASMCYLKSMPEASGGVKLVKGSGKLKDVFTSSTKVKFVKITMSGFSDFEEEEEEEGGEEELDGPDGEFPNEGPKKGSGKKKGPKKGSEQGAGEGSELGPQPHDIYVRVSSLAENQEDEEHYHVSLLFCDADSGKSVGYEDIRVTKEGQLLVTGSHNEDRFGSSNSTITAGLKKTESGEFVFDDTQAKQAQLLFSGGEELGVSFQFKADITTDPNGTVRTKILDSFGQDSAKRLVVSKIKEGQELADLVFSSGAVRDQFSVQGQLVHDHSTGTSWDGQQYALDEESELLSSVSDVDFTQDPFYSELSEPGFEAPFDCDVKTTHTIKIKGGHRGFAEVGEECEKNFIEGMDFCHENLRTLEDKAFDSCFFE